ncbi:MAG TPA: hypothetical protein VJR46_11160 [Candidatus Dormibacteraeota bacterium]|nr:hypothetical protein [Candidatus Dormibacteraeota bacterium]
MSAVNVVLPLMSSVLSFVFAAMVLDQWWQRRRAFQLVWAIGLLWYGISAGTEFAGSAFGWSEPLYRTWYLIGALYVPPYLGLGTIYLLAKTRFGYFAGATVIVGGALSLLFSKVYPGSTTTAIVVFAIALAGGTAIILTTAVRRPLAAHIAAAVLVAGSVLGAYVVLTASLSAPGFAVDPHTHVPVGSAFPGYVRVITPPENIAGALVLVFGALYSAYVYMPKKRVLPAAYMALAIVANFVASLPSAATALVLGRLNTRVPATILIAVGAFIPGLTSGLNRFGVTWSFFLGEFLGLLLIFLGFLVSEEVFRNVRLGATLWSRSSEEVTAG